ncbi:MAG TPA: glycosyltransferase family 2 protein [Chthoniobacterales bacterium]|jgi:glycosyltransferase involved in cell wall biosynthesis|nr:glycosyltransferase family 2 protein [Chthoniobacterales bacterium]
MTEAHRNRLAPIRAKVAAVIPAYHEEKHIGEVVLRTRAHLDHVLVVDDGSMDKTAEHARVAGAEVIVHPQNRGKGESIKTGLRRWLDRQFDFVIVLDADGQHPPEEIDRFLRLAASDSAALLIGNRMNDVARMPRLRRMVNRYMSKKISRVCGQEIPDTQCGFRMLHRQLIQEVLGGTARFDYETEMLFIASRKNFRIESVPISTVYSDEVSSIHPVRDTIRFLKLMWRYRSLNARSWPARLNCGQLW